MDLWARFGIHENDGINIWTRWEFFFACVFFFSLWVGFFVGYKYKHTHTHTHTDVFGEKPFNISFLLFQYVCTTCKKNFYIHRKNDLPAPARIKKINAKEKAFLYLQRDFF